MNPVLDLRGFGLAFHARVVLQSIDLAVPGAGCVVLLGPSGTGKSSLVRTLAGLHDANRDIRTWGVASYLGRPLGECSRPALVTQKSQLLMSTVLENMLSGMPDRSQWSRREQIDIIGGFAGDLAQGWLMDRLTLPAIDLPVVEQRAIGILREAMREVLHGPGLLMIDEPTAGLKEPQAQQLVALMRLLARRMPLLVISHHLAQTRQLADRVVLIASGTTQESSSVEDFFALPASEAGRHFLRTGSCPEGVQEAACSPAEPDAQPIRSGVASARLGPRGFAWLIPGKLAGTPWPGIVRDTSEDLSSLRQAGVTWLVSLTEVPFDAALAALHGLRCMGLPVRDMDAPTLTQAWSLCETIERLCAQGEVVAVHCKAGLGRTGTLLAAFWIWHGRGLVSAQQAITHVRGIEGAMIQSPRQVEFLHRFADVVARPPAHAAIPEPLSINTPT